jgi:hypothetical protein
LEGHTLNYLVYNKIWVSGGKIDEKVYKLSIKILIVELTIKRSTFSMPKKLTIVILILRNCQTFDGETNEKS